MIDKYVISSEVVPVNDLITEDTSKPLSASMGKKLNEDKTPMVVVPQAAIVSETASSDEILAAWGGIDKFREAAKVAAAQECAVIILNSNPSLPSQVGLSNRSTYTDDNNFIINIGVIKLQSNRVRYTEYGLRCENGKARLLRDQYNLVLSNDVANIQEMSKDDYTNLETKDKNTLYSIPK